MSISELALGLKWSFDLDPVTGGYVPRISIVNPDGGESIFEDGALTIIDFAHKEVHEGDTYQVSSYTGSVADNGNWSLLISLTGTTKEAHLTWEISSGGDAEVKFYENVTGTSYGAKLHTHNMNFDSDNVSEIEVFINPTITVFNPIVRNALNPGGDKSGSPGGTTRENTEWILKPGRRYLLQGYNRGGGAKPMSVSLQWYELRE